MRAWLTTVCTIIVLTAPGCTRLGGKFQPVDKCSSEGVSPAAALAKAPAWIPGSPARIGMPTSGCVGGDGSHHTDRLCAVADVESVNATETSADLAGAKSLRLLTEDLNRRLHEVVGDGAPADQITDLSKQLKAVIGRVTGIWRSPNCTTYAIAEMKLADFQFVIQGPSLSKEVRAILLNNTDKIIGKP